MLKISVVLCTHNPDPAFFNAVLLSLKNQTMTQEFWELIIIDNCSDKPVSNGVDLGWHYNARIIREENLGLIHARMRGAVEAGNEIIVSVDDDTPLYSDYLENVQNIYTKHPRLGVIGGKTIAEFSVNPPTWIQEFYPCLAIRDLGDEVIISEPGENPGQAKYPEAAPLLIAPKRSCLLAYYAHYKNNALSQSLGRKGNDLRSGEDNDINFFIYRSGFALGYFPQLKFTHLIPARRLERKYLSKLSRSMSRSWVELLDAYNCNPWKPIAKWTSPLRKARSFFVNKAWASDPGYIRWQTACGKFDALSEL